MTAASVDTVVQVKARTSTCCRHRHRRKPRSTHLPLRRITTGVQIHGMEMQHCGSSHITSDKQCLYSARRQQLQ